MNKMVLNYHCTGTNFLFFALFFINHFFDNLESDPMKAQVW